MRILGVCADPGIRLDGVKGATIHLLALWRALASQGAEVFGIAAARDPAALPPVVPGLRLLPVPPPEAGAAEPTSALLACARDVSSGRAPAIVLERLALDSDVGVELAALADAALVVEVNAPLEEEARRFRGMRITDRIRRRQGRLLASADLVYCVSDELVSYVRERGARPDAVRVLANGVDVEAFAGRRPASGTGIRVGFVGNFREWHGLELLVEAFARVAAACPELHLDLLGDGPSRPQLEERVGRLGLESRVCFLGARPHEEVPAFLGTVDVAVAPAPAGLDYYFSPLKVYEYAAAGCALVAPRVGQVARRFGHGIDAWLVEPGSTDDLARALLHLAREPGLRRELGCAARARATAEFGWDQVARTLLVWCAGLPVTRARPA